MIKCKKCGRELSDSEVMCDGCGSAVYENHLLHLSKAAKWVIGAIVVIILIIVFVIVNEQAKLDNEVDAVYDGILAELEDNDFYMALSDLEDFRDDYADISDRYSEKADELEEVITTKMYNERDSEDFDISDCETYLEFYPNGRYVYDMKQSLENHALSYIEMAERDIKNDDVLTAYDKLEKIIGNIYVSEDTKTHAEEIKNSIVHKVAREKADNIIVGTWKKPTGVIYTFEKGGHMSANLLKDYDQSAGSAFDGSEVKGLLGEIDLYGRAIRGGTWKYLNLEKRNGINYAFYELNFYGSSYYCFADIDNPSKLGIALKLFPNEVSVLTKY